jgi:hypothetical protein
MDDEKKEFSIEVVELSFDSGVHVVLLTLYSMIIDKGYFGGRLML